MRWLKNPMANAVYVALITAIYAAIFIVSSEFVMSYENLLSDSTERLQLLMERLLTRAAII